MKMLAYTFPGAHGQLYPLSSILPALMAHGDDCCACSLPTNLTVCGGSLLKLYRPNRRSSWCR